MLLVLFQVMCYGVQVYFQFGLVYFLFQRLYDLFKLKNPCALYKNCFIPYIRKAKTI